MLQTPKIRPSKAQGMMLFDFGPLFPWVRVSRILTEILLDYTTGNSQIYTIASGKTPDFTQFCDKYDRV